MQLLLTAYRENTTMFMLNNSDFVKKYELKVLPLFLGWGHPSDAGL